VVLQLLPAVAEIDPVAAHASASRPTPAQRPWTLLNMVASIDGATAVDGLSGPLGGPADKDVFRAIRAVADVILVAAGTARAERYGPPRTSEALQAQRVARGQAPHPRLAVVTASLDLDPASPMFAEAHEPPLVLTTQNAPQERADALAEVAAVERCGTDRVDLASALAGLRAAGCAVVVCEGGPSLNGQLLAAGLIDEVDLTLAPTLVGGASARVAVGEAEAPTPMALAHLWQAGDLLLARYVRADAGGS
jgi:riboflavin-specific deaminase-like protein